MKREDKMLSFEEKLKRSAQAPKKPFEYKPVFSGFESKLGQFQPTKKYTPEQLDDIARGQGVFAEGSAALPGMPPVVETAAKKEEKQTGTKGTEAAQAAENKALVKGPATFAQFLADIKGAGPKGQYGEEFEKFLSEQIGDTSRLSRKERTAMAKGFLKFASVPAPGGIGQAAAAGLTEYATGVEAARDAEDKFKFEAQKARAELDKARRAEERGDVAAAREAYDKYEDRMSRLQSAQISAGAAGQNAQFEREAVAQYMKDNPGTTFSQAYAAVKGAGRMESVEVQRAKAGLEGINEAILSFRGDRKSPEYAALLARRAEIIKFLTPGGGIGGGQATQTSAVVPKDIQSILSKYPQR